ncbi:hypothetical protein Agub_g8808 [Astrephomene gubernaculifera]|uniref:Uncharacterized protein n=1 Tax=Astrephomene gubernaculifera TaxID=47775 RepID=A0AAD3HNJ5_9CHLO|nr:hypothetical protein Agub_g8808 [Astrephomene gubernaculifera]
MADVFLQQSCINEAVAQLGHAIEDDTSGALQRNEALAEISELLARAKQQKMVAGSETHAQGDVSTPRGFKRSASGMGWAFSPTGPALSPGPQSPIPEVVQTGLGALSSAKKTLTAFQDELNTGLTQLAQQASEARRTASAVRAHVDMLHQLVSPEKAAARIGSPLGAAQAGTPNSEVASLLRVLQEAAEERAWLAETSLRTPSPHQLGSLIEDLLRSGGKRSHNAAAALGSDGATDPHGIAEGADQGGPAAPPTQLASGRQPAPGQQPQDSAWQHVHAGPGPWTAGGGVGAKAPPGASQPADMGLGQGAVASSASTTSAEIAEQAEQLLLLQSGVQLLEAQRKELLGKLADTSSKVSSCTIELEAVRSELEAAKAELDAKERQLQALHEQHHAVDSGLQEKLGQFQHLESLVQTSSAQLAELEAAIAAASAATARTAPSAAASGALVESERPRSHRTKRRVKRHVLGRRSLSCGDLSTLLSGSAAARQASNTITEETTSAATTDGGHGTACDNAQNVSAATAAGAAQRATAPASAEAAPAAAPAPDERLAALYQELQALAAEHSKALVQLEQERHAGMAQHAELVNLRQKLRAQQASDIVSNAGSTGGLSASSSLKRPLAASMSGMEDLLEEAAADLDQLEGHIVNAKQHLLGLQAQNLELTQQVSGAIRSKAEAEAQAREEMQRVKALRQEADTLQRTMAANQASSTRLTAQLADAKAELEQLEAQAQQQREHLQQCREAAQEQEERSQEAHRRLLQTEHSRDEAEQARRAVEHQLGQLQAHMEEVERRTKQAEEDTASARKEASALADVAQKARQDQSAALEELERLRRESASAGVELAALTERLAVLREECQREKEAADSAVVRRKEAEGALQECLEELRAQRAKVQEGEAGIQDVQAQLAKLRQEQQELVSTVERHEQRAAAAERKAEAAEQELQSIREQVAAAQRQLAEAAAQTAALRNVPGGINSGFVAGTPGLQATPAAGMGMAMGSGIFASPALDHGSGLHGGPMGQFAAQQNFLTIMQLQAETERLQVAMVQAQSRQRLAEQRASDAEQMCNELQARLSNVRAQAFRSDLGGPSPSGSTGSVHVWRAKADELQQELEASQHLLGRYKTRLAAAQDECSGLEEGLQRERAATSRLRQQVDTLQQELQEARSRLHQKLQHTQQQQGDAGSGALHVGHSAQPAIADGGSAAAAAASPAGKKAVSSEQVEQAAQQLRKLQLQVARQQESHKELLEGHAKLQQQGAAMRSQLEEAAGQLVTLKAQFEKGKRKVEHMKDQQAELQGRIAALTTEEQLVRSRLQELKQQTAAQESSNAALMQSAQHAQHDLLELRTQVARVQQELAAAEAQRDAILVSVAEAERRMMGVPQQHQQGHVGAGGPVVSGVQAAERLAGLEQELRTVKQAYQTAEETLAEERRQLQQCKAELAAALTVGASHGGRLQDGLERLQAQVAQLQAAPAAAAYPSAATGTPVPPHRQLAVFPGHQAGPSMGGETPAPDGNLSLRLAAAHAPPAVWDGTQADLAEARRELHELQLRIAVANADEARLSATCSELRRQVAVAEQDLSLRRQQVAEAEQRLAAVQAGTAQGVKEAEIAAELSELRSMVRTLQQQAHKAETLEAEAKHQSQLAAMRVSHAEEQLRLQQQQSAQQAQVHAARLDEAKAASERERRLAAELQDRISQLQRQAEEQASAMRTAAQQHATALQSQAQQHGSRVAALEAALTHAQAQDSAASAALATARADAERLKAEVQRLSMQLLEARDAKQQLSSGVAEATHGLAGAQAEAVRLNALVTQLQGQLTEAERARTQLASEAARNAAALAVAEAAEKELRAEVQSLAGRLGAAERSAAQLREEARGWAQELSAARAERGQLQERAARSEAGLAESEAAASQLRVQLAQAKAEAAHARGLGEVLSAARAEQRQLRDRAARLESSLAGAEAAEVQLRTQLTPRSSRTVDVTLHDSAMTPRSPGDGLPDTPVAETRRLQQRVARLEANLAEAEANAMQLRMQMAAARDAADAEAAVAQSLRRELHAIRADHVLLQERVGQLEVSRAEVEAAAKQLRVQLAEAKAVAEVEAAAVRGLREELGASRSEAAAAVQGLREELNAANSERRELQARAARFETSLPEAEAALAQLRKQLEEARAAADAQVAVAQGLREELAAAHQERGQLQARVSCLEGSLAEAENTAVQSRMQLTRMKAVMEARAEAEVQTDVRADARYAAMAVGGEVGAHGDSGGERLRRRTEDAQAQTDVIQEQQPNAGALALRHAEEVARLQGMLAALEAELSRRQDDHRRCLSDIAQEHSAAMATQTERSRMQQAALQELAANCDALRGQRDTAIAELEEAAAALRAADARARELELANEKLQAEVARLEQLALEAITLIDHLQQERKSKQRPEERPEPTNEAAAGDTAKVGSAPTVISAAVATTTSETAAAGTSSPHEELSRELELVRQQLTAQTDACEQLRQQLAALEQQQQAKLQEVQAEELQRLQGVRDEYARLEQQLQAELERTQAAAAQVASELKECQQALAAAERDAREAVQEALRSAQQASTFQAQLLTLQQRQERRQADASSAAAAVSRKGSGGMTSAGGSRPAQPAVGAAGRPAVVPPQSKEALQSSASELEQLRAQCAAAERQRVAQQEELQRVQSRLASVEARHATALQQVAALNAELSSRDGGPRQRLLDEEEVQLRVAQQAAADAGLLCELRGQLHASEERLARALEQVEQAEKELERTQAEVAKLRKEQQQQRARSWKGRQRRQTQGGRRHGQGRRSDQGHGGASACSSPCSISLRMGAAERSEGEGDEREGEYGSDGGGGDVGLQRGNPDILQRAVQRVMSALVRKGLGAAEGLTGCNSSSVSSGCDSESESECLSQSRSAARRRAAGRQQQQQQQRARAPGVQRWLRQSYDSVIGGRAGSLAVKDDAPSPVDSLGRADSRDGLRKEILHVLQDLLPSLQPQERPMGRRPGCDAQDDLQTPPALATGAADPPKATPAATSAVAACQTDETLDFGSALVPMSRITAAATYLAELQQQQAALLAKVATLRCQAAEAEALAAARTARVAELQAREQQLEASCGALKRQVEESSRQLEDNASRCQASLHEMRALLDDEVGRLRQQRSWLLADVEHAKNLLRDCTGALRMARVSLQAHSAVDGALASLAAAAAADAGGPGPQSLHHVRVVFGCMAELCGRAEALAATLGPLVSRLSAVTIPQPHDSDLHLTRIPLPPPLPHVGLQAQGSLPNGPGAVAPTIAAATVGPAAAAAAAAGTAAASSYTQAVSMAAGAGAGAAASVVSFEEVQKALKRAYLQLHERARKFDQVLKAVAAGEPLPAEVLHEGFQRLWNSTEEQLGDVLRLTAGPSQAAPLLAVIQPGSSYIGSHATEADAASAPGIPCDLTTTNSQRQHVNRDLTSLVPKALPASPARSPLGAIQNRIGPNQHQPQQQHPQQVVKNRASTVTANAAPTAANRRAPATRIPDGAAGNGRTSGGGGTTARPTSHAPQPQQHRPLHSPRRTPPLASPPPVTRQQPQQQARRLPLQQSSRPHAAAESHMQGGIRGAAAPAGMQGGFGCSGENPQRRGVEAQLQQVLSLAKEVQAKGKGTATASRAEPRVPNIRH